MARVSDILRHKGSSVVTVGPDQTVAAVVEVLNRNRIGAAPVVDSSGHMAGIVSERDVLHGISRLGAELLGVGVRHLMTTDVVTCTAADPVLSLMEIMTLRRIRHLPVLEDGALAGIVSIGDLMKHCLSEAHSEVEDLRRYIAS